MVRRIVFKCPGNGASLRLGLILLTFALAGIACSGPQGPIGPPGPPGPPGPGIERPAAAVPASLAVSPLTVVEGSRFTLAGAGFQPGETVLVYLMRGIGDAVLTGRDVNKDGAFQDTVPLASAFGAGTYTVKAVGVSGTVATTPLIIMPRPTPTTTPMPTATPGAQ